MFGTAQQFGRSSHVLGVDVGSQSIKAVLLDPNGAHCASGSYALAMSHPHGGWAEQDPRDWYEGLRAVIAQCLAEAGVAGTEVAVLCLACQVDGVVPLALDGEALGPAIIWLDRRAHEQANTMAQRVGTPRLFEITGLVPDASHAGPKILWLRDHDAETFERAAAFPPAAGYLLYRLTGRLALDHANASSSLLYDVSKREWSHELLDTFDLGAHRLGEILGAGDVAGQLTSAAAEHLGLSVTCAVLVGTGDEHAASIGAGAIHSGMVTDVTGTAEPVTVASSTVVFDHDRLVETHAHAIGDAYLIENPGFVSGGSTLWFARNVLRVSHDQFFELADAADPGADGVLFVPALSGSMTPTWNGHMRGVFAGLAMPHTSGTMARAILEGCAYALRDVTDRFESLGLGHDEIRVVGGGAASTTWMQIKADVTGRPVRRVLAAEATALGAALLAGIAAGIFANLDEAVGRAVVLAPDPFVPDEARQALYADAYTRYRALYRGVEEALT